MIGGTHITPPDAPVSASRGDPLLLATLNTQAEHWSNVVGMIPLVAEHAKEIADLCRKHQVQRLDLFGSAATGDFDPESSDLDFLVTFLPEANATYVGVYHRLFTDLRELFGQPVDLVIETDFRNPYFRHLIDQTRLAVYSA